MSRERSESLFSVTPQPEQRVRRNAASDMTPLVPKTDDRLIKDDKRSDDDPMQRELKAQFQNRIKLAQQQNIGAVDVRRGQRLGTDELLRQLERLDIYRTRHFRYNGDVVVWVKVLNDWPRLVVTPLTVPTRLSEPVPELRCDEARGETLVQVVFRPLTLGTRRRLDPVVTTYKKRNETLELTYDHDAYRLAAFRCCFKSWNIPVELSLNDDGELTEEAVETLLHSLHPNLVASVCDELVSLSDLTDDEDRLLSRQGHELFKEDSEGVTHAAESVRLYCEATAFAKEFALNVTDLERLPCRVATMMRQLARLNNEEQHKQIEKTRKSTKPTPKARGGKRR